MALSPVPNIPFALPCTRLYIKAPHGPQSSRSRPQLKLKISPHLLIPCPPLPLRPIGHRLEGVVDVILPIGGRVMMDVKITEEGLGLLSAYGMTDGGGVQSGLRDHIRETLLANSEVLGLLHIPNPDLGIPSSSSSHASQSSTTLQLSMNAAQPTCSPMRNNLIPTGLPIAHLTQLDLTFEWAAPSLRKRRNGTNVEGQDGAAAPLADVELGSESLETGSFLERSTSGNPSESASPMDPSTGLPTWGMHQVNQALKRIMKQYMIKRFPLIFDAHLQKYSATFALHRSIPDSLSRFLATSRAHDTSLEFDARDALEALSGVQDGILRRKILVSANLTNRKPRPTQEDSENGKKGRVKGKGPAAPDAGELVEEYMSALQDCIDRTTDQSQSQPESQSQSHSQRSRAVQEADKKKGRIKLVLGEAVGKIGRTAWEGVSAGRGRNSIGRINCMILGEFAEQVRKIKARRPRRVRTIPSILQQPGINSLDRDGDDNSMIDGDDDGEELFVECLVDAQAESSRSGGAQPRYLRTGTDATAAPVEGYVANGDLVDQIQAGPSYSHLQEEEDEMIYSDEDMIDSDDDLIEEELDDDEMIYSEDEDEMIPDEDEAIQDEDEIMQDLHQLPFNDIKMAGVDGDEMIQSDDEDDPRDSQQGGSTSGTYYMDYESSQGQQGSTQATLSPSTSFSSVLQPESLPDTLTQSLDAFYGINAGRPVDQVGIVGNDPMDADNEADDMIDDDEMIDSPVIEASYKSSMDDVPQAPWASRW